MLSWQTSAQTTDGQTLREPILAQVCRDDSPKPPPAETLFPVPPDPCRLVHEQSVMPSGAAAPSQVVDNLPVALTAGQPRLVAYRVTLLNAKGRSAGPSAPVYAVGGMAPAAVGAIEALPRRGGALIRWKPVNTNPPAPMQLSRTLVANAAGPVEPKNDKRTGSRTAAPMHPSTAPTLREVTLTPEADGRGDPGGMLDRGIHDGDTVRYTAQRVLTVQLTPPPTMVVGRKGKRTETKPVAQAFELKSEPSPTVEFTFHDVIPPSAPTGLAEVAGTGFDQAPSIDLSWEPNPELEIAGYNVYRAVADAHFERLNADLVLGPEYRDTTAEPGKTYLYRVTAVDQHRNESAPSATLKAAVARP